MQNKYVKFNKYRITLYFTNFNETINSIQCFVMWIKAAQFLRRLSYSRKISLPIYLFLFSNLYWQKNWNANDFSKNQVSQILQFILEYAALVHMGALANFFIFLKQK